jgi:hypothetical protein
MIVRKRLMLAGTAVRAQAVHDSECTRWFGESIKYPSCFGRGEERKKGNGLPPEFAIDAR